jgi:LysR family carnitine catabolism transcriptional activator
MNDPFPDISFRHLNAIVALARFGSFIAAASYLGISQPGLTRMVQQTERKLKTVLFVRGQRTVSLTPEGEEFLPFAEHMVGALITQTENMQAGRGLPESRLNVSCLMSISHVVLPKALVEFRRSYPQVAFEVREGVGNTINEDVRSGIVDFGIGNLEDHPPNMITESVMEENLCVIMQRGHPLAGREFLRLPDLDGIPMISMPTDSGLRRLVDTRAMEAGVRLDHKVVTNQYSSLFRFASNGLGIAVVPISALPPDRDTGLAVRTLTPAITRQICIMHMSERPLEPAAEAFLRTLRPLLADATSRSG